MKTTDLIGSAVANTFRSKVRTSLTILSIFVGAFTLTLTSGLGTGINAYIDDTLSGIGSPNAMTVTQPSETQQPGDSGPSEYDPEAVSSSTGGTVTALTPEDIETIGAIDGVDDVEGVRNIDLDYIQAGDGDPYVASVGSLVPGQTAILAEGAEPDAEATAFEVAIPLDYVDALGFTDAADAVGSTVTLAVSDGVRDEHVIEATVVGVTEESLTVGGGLLVNTALSDALFEAQSTGIPDDEVDRYLSATVWFDPEATPDEISDLKDALEEAGFSGMTVEDQLGLFTTVIDGIVLVLNAFAVIALLAAAFGIVNTLYMSVQERTREIGLMKAMGMGSGRVFSLFSLEAVFIGFLGSALGAGIAMIAGTALSRVLGRTLLEDLAGLTLVQFSPAIVGSIILLVMGIAFVAGTFPAARAARADPVTSLRYE